MNSATITPLMLQMGKADEFKYPLITGVLVGLERAGAGWKTLAVGCALWLAFAITAKIGDVGQWPANWREWFFVLAPILFNGFLIYAAVAYGVEADGGGQPGEPG